MSIILPRTTDTRADRRSIAVAGLEDASQWVALIGCRGDENARTQHRNRVDRGYTGTKGYRGQLWYGVGQLRYAMQ
jgi:hypothetical protein